MNNIKNNYALDMSKLVNRLRIKAGVMEMGERIAWGSDTALMREAADRIEELEEVSAADKRGLHAEKQCVEERLDKHEKIIALLVQKAREKNDAGFINKLNVIINS